MNAKEILERHEKLGTPLPENRGGSREEAGRRYAKDKKQQIYVMIKGSRVESLGKKRIQEIMIQAVEAAFQDLQSDPNRLGPSLHSDQLQTSSSDTDLLGS